ncbi:hypothetical protein BOTBODRAFT_53523 [Botryobasidium botryosum FD-172 SS1]|uniref:Uncharacterized protein n=1 Tax=Botryobasidium botryosum (strain FD-172 SS1) TaxID=930990 RepID=A0A067N0Y9_BOTB1|nr:hypothetical protein BOTBODRAFT_53523 [Botryobasidium botryosum FD-172 SS1]
MASVLGDICGLLCAGIAQDCAVYRWSFPSRMCNWIPCLKSTEEDEDDEGSADEREPLFQPRESPVSRQPQPHDANPSYGTGHLLDRGVPGPQALESAIEGEHPVT